MEWALIADGVPADEVYKVLATDEGQARAFAKLYDDQERHRLLRFVVAGAPAPQRRRRRDGPGRERPRLQRHQGGEPALRHGLGQQPLRPGRLVDPEGNAAARTGPRFRRLRDRHQGRRRHAGGRLRPEPEIGHAADRSGGSSRTCRPRISTRGCRSTACSGPTTAKRSARNSTSGSWPNRLARTASRRRTAPASRNASPRIRRSDVTEAAIVRPGMPSAPGADARGSRVRPPRPDPPAPGGAGARRPAPPVPCLRLLRSDRHDAEPERLQSRPSPSSSPIPWRGSTTGTARACRTRRC